MGHFRVRFTFDKFSGEWIIGGRIKCWKGAFDFVSYFCVVIPLLLEWPEKPVGCRSVPALVLVAIACCPPWLDVRWWTVLEWFPLKDLFSCRCFLFASSLFFFSRSRRREGAITRTGSDSISSFIYFLDTNYPIFITQIYLLSESWGLGLQERLAGLGRWKIPSYEFINPVPGNYFYCSQWREVCQELLAYSNSWRDCHEADHDWLTRGRDLLNVRGRSWHSLGANCATFEIKMDDQWIVELLG